MLKSDRISGSRSTVPAGQRVTAAAFAQGVQIYTCTAPTATTGYAWVFKAPEANLFDERARFAGSHFLGPTWQYKDGSKVTGVVSSPLAVGRQAVRSMRRSMCCSTRQLKAAAAPATPWGPVPFDAAAWGGAGAFSAGGELAV